MKNLKYLNVILTIIATLLALLVWEQRLVIRDELVLNRFTGEVTSVWDRATPSGP